MLAARNQEHLRGLQAKTPGARYPKTPIKVPLNDENAAHVVGGAKGNLTGRSRSRGNENALTSKAVKGIDKSNFVTPMQPRSRAVLGDKTTNVKARALQPANVKSAVRSIEKSHAKAPTTVQPKAKQPQAEIQKLVVHAEETEHQNDDNEVEYCPPKPKDLPYESDVFPEGVLTFEGLKRENMFKGYYDYYVNPVDEHGVSLSDRVLAEKTRKAIEECDRQVQEDIENFEWSIEDELEEAGVVLKKKANPPAPNPAKPDNAKQPFTRKAPPTIVSRDAATALANLDDTTKSMQRRVAKPTENSLPSKKQGAGLALPGFRSAKQPTTRLPVLSRKTTMENKALEVASRATIGYNKGRATASALAQRTAKPNITRPQTAMARSHTTISDDADEIITPARDAEIDISAAAAAEDQEWKERVPFLSIFNPDLGGIEDEDEECDLLAGGLPDSLYVEDDDDFELKLVD
ncbi:hypothetical protein SLS62_000796 [Diatrype stigma]|uniref:Uncharacterized protein n=1 Tax=Diatrype stigma TaxID=117547 RepID=A0AAN9YWJ2_9PEZI